jgi:thymidine kinase
MAKLYFRYGAMNSGKSTAVLQVAHNYEELGMKIILVKAKPGDQVSVNIPEDGVAEWAALEAAL